MGLGILKLHVEVAGSQVPGLGATVTRTLIARRRWHPGSRKACSFKIQRTCSLVFLSRTSILSDQSICKCMKPDLFCLLLQYLIKHPRSTSEHGLLPPVRCHHRAPDWERTRGVLCPLERSPRERSWQGTVGTSGPARLLCPPDSIPYGFDFSTWLWFGAVFLHGCSRIKCGSLHLPSGWESVMVGGGGGERCMHMLEGRQEVLSPIPGPRHLPDRDYRMWCYAVQEFSYVNVRKPDEITRKELRSFLLL